LILKIKFSANKTGAMSLLKPSQTPRSVPRPQILSGHSISEPVLQATIMTPSTVKMTEDEFEKMEKRLAYRYKQQEAYRQKMKVYEPDKVPHQREKVNYTVDKKADFYVTFESMKDIEWVNSILQGYWKNLQRSRRLREARLPEEEKGAKTYKVKSMFFLVPVTGQEGK
jgi:hypothetical protein